MTRHFGGMGPVRHHSDTSRYVIIFSIFLLVVCGFVAVIFLSTDSSNANQPTTVVIHEPQIEMVEVLVPIQKVEQGVLLEPAMFRRENRQKVGLSPGIIRDYEQIKGNYSRSIIVADQPLHEDYITKVKPINPITQEIPDGYRAVTIRVDAKTAVEGWAVPGARVDVVWASKIRDQQAITVIVENAKVLSADKNPDANQKAGAPVPSTVTLLVTSEDAKKVQLASISGTLSLSLRGDRDSGKSSAGGSITIDSLLGKSASDNQPLPSACKGKVRTCQNGVCEELCLSADGKLSPVDSGKQ